MFMLKCTAGETYSWISLTRSTAMFSQRNKEKDLYKNRVQFPEDKLELHHGRRFFVKGLHDMVAVTSGENQE